MTVDVVLVAVPAAPHLEVLLIRRKAAPFEGRWALPGGFLDIDEEIEVAARRELFEETGLRVGSMVEVGTYGRIGRDPRGRTISVAFLALHCGEPPPARAGDDAAEAAWFAARRLPPMAFDHGEIARDALARLRELIEHGDRVLSLLPASFTLGQVRSVYEAVLKREISPSALRRRLLAGSLIEPYRRKPGLYRRRGRRGAG